MRKNEELQNDVLHAIKWEPLLKHEKIGVLADNGVVTLSGNVNSLKKKHQVEDIAKSVVGVKAVVETINVTFDSENVNDDNTIAVEILRVLKWNLNITNQKIKVENGWVTIEGELQWKNQKESAKYAISSVLGVKGVTNNITIVSDHSEIEKKDIEYALARNWAINELGVKVTVSGNQVTLSGVVHSLYQKDQAEIISWNAKGVKSVVNELYVK
jgi:osmotically-inducible protein OsmY